jgi:hypothetical protein
MMSLWTLFVENVFGSFWASVIGLSLFMYVVMAYLGNMSFDTVIDFLSLFLIAIVIGYSFQLALLLYFLYLLSIIFIIPRLFNKPMT